MRIYSIPFEVELLSGLFTDATEDFQSDANKSSYKDRMWSSYFISNCKKYVTMQSSPFLRNNKIWHTHTHKTNKIYKMNLQNSYNNATRHPNPSKYKSVPVHRYDKFGWCIYCLEKHQFYMTYLSLHSCYCIKWYQLTRWCDTTCLPR